MADKSNIQWTNSTWNPVVGCSIVSPGCTNCYAMKMAARLEAMGQPIYAGTTKKVNGKAVWTGKVERSNWGQVIKPLSWRRPRMVFVNSMSDLFHEEIPDSLIDIVFAVMALCPQHKFQVLTKRAERMQKYMTSRVADVYPWMVVLPHPEQREGETLRIRRDWPLPNVWLGVSCERQKEADERIPFLLNTPAAVRFISAEPLLEPISLLCPGCQTSSDAHHIACKHKGRAPIVALDWVIVGGESGPDARPFHVEWADDLVEQCKESGAKCFVKQFGSMPMSDGYPLELKDRKGGDEKEWPERLNIREFPEGSDANYPRI